MRTNKISSATTLRSIFSLGTIFFVAFTSVSCRPDIRGDESTGESASTTTDGTGSGGGSGSGTTTTSSVTWSTVDAGGSNGLNKSSTLAAITPQLTSFNSKLYATWKENNSGGTGQIRVAVYNGNDSSPSWSFVDGNGANGLNKLTMQAALNPQLTVFNSKLYAAWDEDQGGGVYHPYMKVYNGNDSSPGWTSVGGPDGIYKVIGNTGTNVQLAVFNDKLYATFSEVSTVNQIRVVVYNGNDGTPSFSFVDGNGATGLNKLTAVAADTPQLTVFNSKLYLTWSESDGMATQIRVRVYNGDDSSPSWTFVDGNVNTGLNKNTTQNAIVPQLTVFNSKLYLTWEEVGSNGKRQIRVRVYNGDDSSPSWTFVDGNAATGLNKDTSQHAYTPQLVVKGTELFLVWAELNSSSFHQIRTSLYNGNDSSPSWSIMDGNGANGLNKDTSKPAENPQCTAFNSNVYLTWQETNGTATNIMVKLGVSQ